MISLRDITINGIIWSAIGKFGNTAISFFFGIVLARLLTPDDYGTVAMIGIFFSIASIITDSGFSVALIRKQNRTEVDCSTVFFFNIAASVFCFIILFIFAPEIADFFNRPILKDIVRILGLNLIIGSFGSVQIALFTSDINIKILSLIDLISSVLSGAVGILVAYNGLGVWSIVFMGIVGNCLKIAQYWYHSKWRPILVFSKQSFKELFGYGSKLLGSSLLDSVFSNIQSFVIGKFYTAKDLGYYSRGSGIANIIGTFVYGTIHSTTLSALAKVQDDKERLVLIYRKFIKVCSAVVFFVMVLLATIANPFITLIYGDKWEPAVIYLQFFCFSAMFYHVHAINVNILLATGHSGLNLKIEILKKIWIVIALAITIPIGPLAMCAISVVTTQVSLVINTYYNGKLFNYGYFKQWKDILPYIIFSCLACLPAFLMYIFGINKLVVLIGGSILSTIIYIGFLHFTKDEAYNEITSLPPFKKITSFISHE